MKPLRIVGISAAFTVALGLLVALGAMSPLAKAGAALNTEHSLPEPGTEVFLTHTLSIEPAFTPLAIGDVFTVNVVISDIQDLGAFEYTLAFSPSVVLAARVQLGDLPASTGRTVIELGPDISNTLGAVDHAFFSFGAQPGPDGGGMIASVVFTATGYGTSPLDLIAAQAVNAAGTVLAPTIMTDGLVTVSVAFQSVVFSDDFSTDPNLSGLWRIHRRHPDDMSNEASWDPDSQTFYLTRPARDRAVAIFADFPLTAAHWEASFRYRVGGGSGADGLVFLFYKDENAYGVPGCGGSLGFQIAPSCYPQTDIAGYGIEFDGYYNPPSHNIGDPSGNHIALVKDSVSNHLTHADDLRTEDDQWHDAIIQFEDGHVTVVVDGGIVLDYVIPAPDYTHSGVGFSAATGLRSNNHIIDDFRLTVEGSQSDLELAQRFAPYMYFHQDDIYRPISVTVPLEYALLSNYDENRYQFGPTPEDLANEPWQDDADAYTNLLGDGPVHIRNVYFNLVEPLVSPLAFARVFRDQNDPNGKIAIQYWLYYYDNPWTFNHHEGDWEMVQVVLDQDEQPLYAAYAQHLLGSKRLWRDVEKVEIGDEEHPKVFVARGSHASYFKPYDYWQLVGTDTTVPTTTVGILPIELLPESQDEDTWLYFVGHWGDKGKGILEGGAVFDNDGPRGPSHPDHGDKWDDPIGWSDGLLVLWDENAYHNKTIKFNVSVLTPIDVHVYKLPGWEHVGWRNGQVEIEMEDAEYIDNPEAGIFGRRTIILHKMDPDDESIVEIRTFRMPTNHISTLLVTEPITIEISYPDLKANTVISALLTLTDTWGISTTGIVSVHHGSDFHLKLDIDGDGEFDQDVPPTTLEETPFDFTPPSAITDLKASTTATGETVLAWTAPGDDANTGTAVAYDIRYSTVPITDSNWVSATLLVPPTPSEAGTTEVFTVTGVSPGRYYFGMEAIDDMMRYSGLSNVVHAEIQYTAFTLTKLVMPAGSS